MSAPTVIQGPAYVKWGSKVYYSAGPVMIRYQTRAWNPTSAMFGPLGPRLSNRIVTVSFQPVGKLDPATAVSEYWPVTPASIGSSLISDDDLTVAPRTGNKITFPRAGLTRLPSLRLSALSTCWQGEMEFTCLSDGEWTAENAWQTIAATSADTSFDPSKIISPRYTASWGSVTGIEPDEQGFVVEPELRAQEIIAANWGVLDVVLSELSVRCRFRPISLSEAQMAQMLSLQGSGAKLPGDALGANDLVISGTGVTVTIYQVGPSDAALHYAPGEWRQGEVVLHNQVRFSSGAPQALWSISGT